MSNAEIISQPLIRQRVENGHLAQHGSGRATWYTAGK